MRYFITSSKDSTIYTDYKSQNTGIDQILEVTKYKSNGIDRSSRALIYFDLLNVSESISNGDITNPTFSLNLKATALRELAHEFDIEILPISQSWSMGLGKRQDNPKTTDGVSYKWRDKLSGSAWNNIGGDFITSTTESLHYGKFTIDLNKDITNIVNSYINGTLPNHGLVIKFTDSEETDNLHYGSINFFSSETNTIYKPKISVEWDDSILNSGSLDSVGSEPFITISNLKKSYKVNKKYKFKLFSRQKYPSLTYDTGSAHAINHYLPTSSQYSIVDNVTEETIIPFGSNSKLSIDSYGNYFVQDFNGWEPNRYYRILIKIDDGSGVVNIIDKNFTFNLVE